MVKRTDHVDILFCAFFLMRKIKNKNKNNKMKKERRIWNQKNEIITVHSGGLKARICDFKDT